MTVVNFDRNGNIIPDLSKITVPMDSPVYEVVRAIRDKRRSNAQDIKRGKDQEGMLLVS